MSQRELAQLVGVSNAEICRIENGDRQEPSPKTLKDIGKALGVNYLELFLKYGYVDEELLEGKLIIREVQRSLTGFSNKELLMELLKRELICNAKTLV